MKVFISIGFLASTAFISTAQAQEANDANDGVTTEDIIVTAQRRAERLQDVPISVIAISSEQLVRGGVMDTRDLNLLTPGLNFQTNGAFAQPTIRGVGTSLTSSESNVAIYLDGVYQGAQIGNLMSLGTVQNIQVLKGPQGTLFGRNATGGAILITTVDPVFETEARTTFSYGRFDEVRASGFVNVPLVADKIALNLAANYEEADGYVRNITANVSEAKFDELSIRAKLLLQPSDNLKIILTGSKTRRDDNVGISHRPDQGNINLRRTVPGLVVPTEPYVLATNVVPEQEVRDTAANLRVIYEADWGTLSSISSWRHLKLDVLAEGDYTSVAGSAIDLHKENKTYTQEINIASNTTNWLSWVAGAYYYKDKAPSRINVLVGAAGTSIPITDTPTSSEAFAFYGEATANLSEKFKVIAGLRYSNERRKIERLIAPTFVGESRSGSWTPRFSAIYAVDDQSNIYATYSRGFKSGEFNTVGTLVDAVNPEIVDSFEVGFKRSSRMLSFNIAGFYYNYKNIQAQSVDLTTLTVLLQNASATIYGIDADTRFTINDNWSVSAGAAWTHAQYDDYPGAQFFYPITPTTNVAGVVPCPATINACGNYIVVGPADGNDLPRSPRFTANAAITARYPIGASQIEASVNASYNSGFYWGVDNRLRQDDFTVVNAQLSWTLPGGRHQVSLWGRNLTNVASQVYGNSAAAGDIVAYSRPRTYGIAATINF